MPRSPGQSSKATFDEYDFLVGHVAATLDCRLRKVRLLGKLGLGYGELDIERTTGPQGDQGFGPFFGLEADYAPVAWGHAFVRGELFTRSSWKSGLVAVGV
ncbi:MAG: hypothetical protein EXS02_13520 [Planctomycetes bacterium]|nr:hypothetical protein [Planctomycetota bacterium]